MDLSAKAHYTKFNLKTRRHNVKFDSASMVFGVNFDCRTKISSQPHSLKSKFPRYVKVKFKLNKILSRCVKFSKKIAPKARNIRFYSAF